MYIHEVNLETSSFCNAECSICPHKSMKRGQGFMEENLWSKILDDCSKTDVRNIHYHLNGEPLMNPQLPQIIRYGLSKNPNSNHGFFTNGALLGKRATEFFPNSLVDRIVVSFDGGTKETYESHRVGLKFEETIQSIKEFIKIRDKYHFIKPKIIVLMVLTKENQHTQEAFQNMWKNILKDGVDEVHLSYPMNWAGAVQVNKPDIKFGRPEICPYLYNFVFILHTGEAVICCMDYEGKEIVGNAREQSVEEIFNGARYQELRKLYFNKKWDKLAMCRECSFQK